MEDVSRVYLFVGNHSLMIDPISYDQQWGYTVLLSYDAICLEFMIRWMNVRIVQ